MTDIGGIVALLGLVLLLSPGGGLVVIVWAIRLAALVIGAQLVFFTLQLRRLQHRAEARRLWRRGANADVRMGWIATALRASR